MPLLASFSFQGTRTLSISGCRKGSDRKESVFVFAKIFKEIISWCCSKPPGYCNGVSNEGNKLSNINFSNFCLWKQQNNFPSKLSNKLRNEQRLHEQGLTQGHKDLSTSNLFYIQHLLHGLKNQISSCQYEKYIKCFDSINNFYMNIYINIDTNIINSINNRFSTISAIQH